MADCCFVQGNHNFQEIIIPAPHDNRRNQKLFVLNALAARPQLEVLLWNQIPISKATILVFILSS